MKQRCLHVHMHTWRLKTNREVTARSNVCQHRTHHACLFSIHLSVVRDGEALVGYTSSCGMKESHSDLSVQLGGLNSNCTAHERCTQSSNLPRNDRAYKPHSQTFTSHNGLFFIIAHTLFSISALSYSPVSA